MPILTFPPSPALAPFVRTFTVVEAASEMTRTLLPETGLVLGFRYAGSASQLEAKAALRLPDRSLSGMRDAVRRMHTSPGSGIILAVFNATGAAHFFAEPLHELFGATTALDDLVPRAELARTAELVTALPTLPARIGAVEQFLLARAGKRQSDALVASAVTALRASRGRVRIGELASTLGIGKDRLEKRFRVTVGTSPKKFASLLRVRRSISAHRAGTSLVELAIDAGYYDQSHFIREFQAVTGQAPRRFFEAGEHC